MPVDASPFYAILRFEEAATVLRAAFRLNLIEHLSANQPQSEEQVCEKFELTPQGGRIFVAVLHAMNVLRPANDGRWQVSEGARECLSVDAEWSRRPYLQMGPTDAADSLIAMLRGHFPEANIPLYGFDSAPSLMESTSTVDVAREISYGLASRARCFATPLADFVLPHLRAETKTIADLGAGSPFVVHAILQRCPGVEAANLVDQKAGLHFAKEMTAELEDVDRLKYVEADIFAAVPPADLYCMSNTAHDWLPADYRRLVSNIRNSISDQGRVIVHEPLMLPAWSTLEQQHEALWMSCYALALYKLCGGRGTCYTLSEHDAILQSAGFSRIAGPQKTTDGCSAICYEAA